LRKIADGTYDFPHLEMLEIDVFASWRDVRRQIRAVRREMRFNGRLEFRAKRLTIVAVSRINPIFGVVKEEGLQKVFEKYLTLRRRT
jgi:hypothetical protein